MAALLSDAEVEALEQELTDDDLQSSADPRESALAGNARRRLAESALVSALAEGGFASPLADVMEMELAAYGIAVMMAWTRTGEIFRQCKAKGRPVTNASLAAAGWSRDDRQEIANETVAHALRYFMDDVLKKGQWDPSGGATLKTYFMGACLLQFPNVFSRWARDQKRWGEVHDREAPVEEAGPGRDAHWVDPTGDAAVRSHNAAETLKNIPDPQTREAARLVMHGESFAEAGKAVGLSAAAVEGRLYRLRRRSQ